MLVYPSITPLPQYKERDSVDPLLDDLLEVEDMYTTVLYNDEVSCYTFCLADVALLPTGSLLGRPGSLKRPKPLLGSLFRSLFV